MPAKYQNQLNEVNILDLLYNTRKMLKRYGKVNDIFSEEVNSRVKRTEEEEN